MNLFSTMTPDRMCALVLLARERRKTRPNLAAWASYHLSLSRAHNAPNPDARCLPSNEARGRTPDAENTGPSRPVA
jgi:hypothetical protein